MCALEDSALLSWTVPVLSDAIALLRTLARITAAHNDAMASLCGE